MPFIVEFNSTTSELTETVGLAIDEFKQELYQHIRAGYCRANVCPMEHRPAKVWEYGVPAATDYSAAHNGRDVYELASPGGPL